MMPGFVVRNVAFSLANVRRLPEVRSAMRRHRKKHPRCAWCGRDDGGLAVHHIRPVKFFPYLASQPENLLTLCHSSRDCHLVVGHMGSWHTWNRYVTESCSIAELSKTA